MNRTPPEPTATRTRRARAALVAGLPLGVVAAAFLVAPAATALSDQGPQTVHVSYADGNRSFVVPAGTYTMTITAAGTTKERLPSA